LSRFAPTASRNSSPGRLPARHVLTLVPSGFTRLRNGRRRLAGQSWKARRKPDSFITEEQVKVVQAKEWLTLKEAALLVNVSPLTLRRWTLAGKVKSKKVGRKHLFIKA
jgi:excisionase family DNA binding protein